MLGKTLSSSGRNSSRDFLPMRNALAEGEHVVSNEMFAGSRCGEAPLLSITIPTYRRHDLLIEAVASAIGQDFDRPFEVAVVDNDPESNGHELVLAALPQIAKMNFRYLRNRENLGMYGNVNHCIRVARGEWITMVHDDDLLHPDFAREMFAVLEADLGIDGLVCQKRVLDQRAVAFPEPKTRRLMLDALQLYRFRGRRSRRIDAGKLFWGCIVGNNVGFICRTTDARSIGGYYPEEYPSCDYFFYARFAERFRLEQCKKSLVTIRVAVNTLLRPEEQLAGLRLAHELQSAYVGTVLPSYWSKISPLLMARLAAASSSYWSSKLTREQVEGALGTKLPRDRPLVILALRGVLGGF